MVVKTRIVLMGTPNFALAPFKALIESGYNIVGLVSQPDRKVGRKQEMAATPTKQLALMHGIKVYQPESIKKDYGFMLELKPDLIITCAYGQFIPNEVLLLPKLGAINIHGSLLPKYRGGAPIHHAIMNDEKETGISIMKMAAKMDAGDVYSQHKLTIDKTDSYDTLAAKMSNLAKDAILKDLPLIIEAKLKAKPQEEKLVTLGYNITASQEKIDWNMPAQKIYNLIRGLSSIPGAHTLFDGSILKIFKGEITQKLSSKLPGSVVALDDGIVVATSSYDYRIIELQLAGKKRMSAKELINGLRNKLINARLQ
jgi:methionyl-tRNA formyltransferase